MIKRIVVPVDFSQTSLRALDYAVQLSRRLDARLTVVHVVEPVHYPMAGDLVGLGLDLSTVYTEIERAARTRLTKLAAKLEARRIVVRSLLTHGTPHYVIVESAKKLKADLIIMSTHGRTGLSHVLMGSVAERVVRLAECPVLTVPGRTADTPSRGRGTRIPQRRATAAPSRSR
jgi:nucleotide-binding universal stress UspA family protein